MALKFLTVDTDDVNAMVRLLDQYIHDRKYLERRWRDLVRKNTGKWVGVYKREIILADSLEALLEGAADKGWDLGGVVVRRLLEERPPVAL